MQPGLHVPARQAPLWIPPREIIEPGDPRFDETLRAVTPAGVTGLSGGGAGKPSSGEIAIGTYSVASDDDPTGGASMAITANASGDFVVFMCQGNQGGTISSATLDGQTIDIHGTVVSNPDSETRISVGTCSGVSSGSVTLAWSSSATELRAHGWIFPISGANLASPLQTPSNDAGFGITWASLTAGAAMFQCAHNGNNAAFTGATDLTWTENKLDETCSSSGYAMSADSNTTTSIDGGGSSQPVTLGIELAAA